VFLEVSLGAEQANALAEVVERCDQAGALSL